MEEKNAITIKIENLFAHVYLFVKLYLHFYAMLPFFQVKSQVSLHKNWFFFRGEAGDTRKQKNVQLFLGNWLWCKFNLNSGRSRTTGFIFFLCIKKLW